MDFKTTFAFSIADRPLSSRQERYLKRSIKSEYTVLPTNSYILYQLLCDFLGKIDLIPFAYLCHKIYENRGGFFFDEYDVPQVVHLYSPTYSKPFYANNYSMCEKLIDVCIRFEIPLNSRFSTIVLNFFNDMGSRL